METRNADFTANFYETYLVNTEEGNIIVTLPDIIDNENSTCSFINTGSNAIIYNTTSGPLINGNSSYTNNTLWQSDILAVGKNNWYKF